MDEMEDSAHLLSVDDPPASSDRASGSTSLKIDDDVDLDKALLSEFLGSFFLVVFGLGAVYATALVTFDTVTVDRMLAIALAYSFSYSAIMYSFSFPMADRRHLPNTRHLNPAITFALFGSGNVALGRALLYWLAQLSGGGIGVIVLYYCTPFEKRNILTGFPLVENVSTLETWVMEIMSSYIAVLVILVNCFGHLQPQPSVAAALDESSPLTNNEVNCLLAAGGVFIASMVGSGVSGGYFNPLFGVGIGMLSGNYEVASIVAPFIGSVAAVLTGFLFGFKVRMLSWSF